MTFNRDLRDILAGGLLIAIGLIAAFHASTAMPLGSWRHMGPGMFPTSLGLLLAALGLLILIPALFRTGTLPTFETRPFLAVCGAVLAFALLIRPAGLVPAIVALTFVATFADSKLGWVATAILAAIMSVGAYLIFIFGLGMPLQTFNLFR
jgi:hypothetical protein